MAQFLALGGLSEEHAAASALALLDEFGSLNEILSASPWWLERIVGCHCARLIAGANHLLARSLAEPLRGRSLIGDRSAVAALLRRLIGHADVEMLIVLHLDGVQRLLCYDLVATGDGGSVEFDPRKILVHAIAREASGIIVAHNHPSGNASPSHADFSASKKLARAAQGLGITVHDHLVIAGGDVRSAMAT